MKLKNILGILLGGNKVWFYVTFLAGLALGLLIKQKLPIKFKEDVDIVPILQLIVTLIVALLITHYGKQKADENRAEKDLIIEQLNDCRTKCREVFAEFSGCCDEQQANAEQQKRLKQGVRDFSNHLYAVRRLIEHSGNPAELVKQHEELQSRYYTFKARITDLNGSNAFTNPATRNSAETAWRESDNQLTKLIIAVNRF
ncbi:MAG: hypothetical protein JNM09_19215 [Blastocatellia bacterium]|nr:hypothetical protein [Blastocatellia bacterium]